MTDEIRTTVSVSHMDELRKLVGLPLGSTADKIASAAIKLFSDTTANQSLEYAIGVLQDHMNKEHA